MYTPSSFIPDKQSSPQPAARQAQPASRESRVPGLLKFLLPAAGAVVGGAAGGGLGGLAGIETGPGAVATGYLGGVAGAGLGAAAGQAGVNDLERLMGGAPPPSASANAQSLGQAGQSGAVGQAIGVPAAKGLGMAFHPIATVANKLDQTLADSPAMIDIAKVLANWRPQQTGSFAQQTVGREGDQAVKELTPNIVAAVKAFQSHVPAENPAPGFGMPQTSIDSLELPAAKANLLKRNLYQQVDYTKPSNNPDVVARKGFANVLKNEVHQAVPAAGTYDALLHLLYSGPDFAKTLTDLIPNAATQNAIRKVSGAPIKAAQTLIPQNGGYLRQLLTGLIAGNGASSQPGY